MLLAISAFVCKQLSVVKTLVGTNYEVWFESLNMYLIILIDYLAMRGLGPTNVLNHFGAPDKTKYKFWYEHFVDLFG